LRRFHEHGVMLFLDGELYTAFIRLQADKGLGRSFAGLLPFVEGLHRLGYIDQEVYEAHKERYSQPLVAEKPLTMKQMKTQEFIVRTTKEFSDVIKQWGSMNLKAQKYYIEKAKKYRDIVPNAKLVLGLRCEKVFSKMEQGAI